jgi:tetratricopeptide (TPR) repeat protein/DNA-binding CsgD family transcriptional regulator
VNYQSPKLFFCFAFLFFLINLPADAQHVQIDSLENLASRQPDTIKVQILNQLADLYRRVDREKAKYMANEARDLAVKLSWPKGMYDAYMILYRISRSNDDFLQALENARMLVQVANTMHNRRYVIESKATLARVYNQMDYYSRAMENLIDVLALCDSIGDQENLAEILNDLGNLHSQGTHNYALAESYYKRSIEVHRSLRQEHGVAVALINLGELSMSRKLYAQAITYLNDALRIEERLKREPFVCYIIGQLGKVYLQTGDYDRSQAMFLRALRLAQKLELKDNESSWLIGLGKVSAVKGKPQESIVYLSQALSLTAPDNYAKRVQVFEGLAEAFESSGNYPQAFLNRQALLRAQDSLASTVQRDKLQELQARYQTQANERAISALHEREKSDQVRMALLTGLGLTVIAVLTLIFISLRLRHKNQIEVNQKRKILFEADMKDRECVEAELRSEIDFKARELTTFTLNLIHKNEMLEDLKEQITEIKKTLPDEDRSKINRIVSNIHLSRRIDKDWDNFTLYFEQVHQGFFDNLKWNFPELNYNDLKLCALLRLNLDTKKIASIMDISPESAKVARYRLRKKLGLQADENLTSFLNDVRETREISGTERGQV